MKKSTELIISAINKQVDVANNSIPRNVGNFELNVVTNKICVYPTKISLSFIFNGSIKLSPNIRDLMLTELENVNNRFFNFLNFIDGVSEELKNNIIEQFEELSFLLENAEKIDHYIKAAIRGYKFFDDEINQLYLSFLPSAELVSYDHYTDDYLDSALLKIYNCNSENVKKSDLIEYLNHTIDGYFHIDNGDGILRIKQK